MTDGIIGSTTRVRPRIYGVPDRSRSLLFDDHQISRSISSRIFLHVDAKVFKSRTTENDESLEKLDVTFRTIQVKLTLTFDP